MNDSAIQFPKRYDLFGVRVSATTYDEEAEVLIQAARQRRSTCVSHLAVHGLISGVTDENYRNLLNQFDVVAPDGMPVKTALNLIYGCRLPENVRGPEFTLRICEKAAQAGVGVYLYGSNETTINALRRNLLAKYPGLRIVGCEPSLFRPLTPQEDAELIGRINDSGAGVVLLGLGCPLQEKFAFQHKGKIHAVLLCVGAAFDFHAGFKKMAPLWMQRNSLEWLYRLSQEPSRLWRRYLYTNSLFMLLLFLELFKFKRYRHIN